MCNLMVLVIISDAQPQPAMRLPPGRVTHGLR